jgi:hypothetical protein
MQTVTTIGLTSPSQSSRSMVSMPPPRWLCTNSDRIAATPRMTRCAKKRHRSDESIHPGGHGLQRVRPGRLQIALCRPSPASRANATA